jgi:hypothetical protein
MKEAESSAMGWWVNPHNHPLPTIIDLDPDQIEWLRGDYLATIIQSAPQLAPEALELVTYYLKDMLPADYDDEH